MKRLNILLIAGITSITFLSSQNTEKKNWLQYYNFSFSKFVKPSPDYAPFTRWWWPGNDVTQDELKREINLFADNNFGGVEIQPMALVFPTKGKGRAGRIMSYDTPEYYENLRLVCTEALKRGLTVDMTDGSGWPAGGPHLTEADNNLTLEYGMLDIPSGSKSLFEVPRAKRGDRPTAKLISLIVVKVLKDTTPENRTLLLDQKSVVNLTSQIKNNKFTFTPSKSNWKAIAFWSMADMEAPMLIAKKDAGFAMNHFDSTKVIKSYNYLFGDRTGMKPYFGNPMRAIFDDSYEFRADRHFSNDFIAIFKANRGYDITSYLPVNMWEGYNNMYTRIQKPGLKPDFKFTDEDWRLRYDYDLTLSDIIGKHFLQPTKNWTESKGLLHRTQPYGLNMDIMATAGLASIPEVETMQFNKGTEGGYKLITSGAHLYNRPVVSCESGVYYNRAFMTTPQKLKMTIDIVFSCGVNQIIWHGTAYQYFPDGYPKEGWFPFYNSALGVNFSSDLNESNPFWKYMSSINQYAQRAQYVLRSGKPQADVLIYYPFLNYSEETANPKEIFLNGYMNDVEPPLSSGDVTSYFRKADTEWQNKTWALINELNAKGITWDWVNDASVQAMTVTADKKLNIRGNIYQSIILFDLPYIQLKSAQHLKSLSKVGANILSVGKLPVIQPSYNNYLENDRLAAQAIVTTMKAPSTTQIKAVSEISLWSDKLDIPVKYTVEKDNLRQIRRVMEDGSIAQFIWNESAEWQTVSVALASKFKSVSWMNAETGVVTEAKIANGNQVTYTLPPFSTIFLYASDASVSKTESSTTVLFNPAKAIQLSTLEQWDIKSDSVEIKNSALFDWKANDQLKFSGKTGIYTTKVNIGQVVPGKSYYLDLGKVYYGADVVINDKAVGTLLYTPFVIDISKYIKAGGNDIKIIITPTKYNEFVGEAKKGNKLFKKLESSELMSQGLIGPVRILEQ